MMPLRLFSWLGYGVMVNKSLFDFCRYSGDIRIEHARIEATIARLHADISGRVADR